MITISDKCKCSGCSACSAVCPKNCIEMRYDSEGFSYPSMNIEICIDCGACEKVCPIVNKIPENIFPQVGYVVQHKDSRILRESTAGGAFTAISEYVIDRGGIVFGAALSDDFLPKHTWVDNKNDLRLFRNSKYVQSFMGDTLKNVKAFLKEGRLVCFSGTPCQVEGLKKYLGEEYDNLVLVDVVCRAVPSPMVYRQYLKLQSKRLDSPIRNIRFRDKYYGYKYSTMNITTDKNQGHYHQGVETDPWLRAFFSGMCLRPSCYDCQFKKRYRISDFTMWDCFNIGRFSKELDDDRGATRLLVHTEKGRKIFKELSSSLSYVQVEPEKIIEGTNEMLHSVPYNEKREDFMKDAAELDSEALFEKYFPNTFRVRTEHVIRMICYKLGIYSLAKKAYVKITHKY